MTKLTFYHNVRVDGGRRTGIEINDTTAMEFYQEESLDVDPALLWYVDLSCEAEGLPREAEVARRWFLDNEKPLVGILLGVAGEIEVGFDVEVRPFRRAVNDGPGGCRVKVVVSAIHRLQAKEVARDLREVAQSWRSLVERLVSESLV
jgi:hypothetical protein